MPFLKKHARLIVCLLISLWAFKLRAERYAGRILWNDELYQLGFIVGPFKKIWERNVYGDFTCFPGDYLVTYPFIRLSGLYKITKSFPTLEGWDKWMLALPHILATVIGFYFLYLMCQKYFKTIWGDIVAFGVLCYNGNLIFHAFEFRPYAVLSTLSLAVFYFSGNIIEPAKEYRRWQKVLLGAFFIFVILFHLYGILIVSLSLIYHVIISRNSPPFKENFKKLVQFFGAVFIVAVPWWMWYASGHPLKVLDNPHGYDVFRYIPNPLVDTIGFLKGIFGNLVGYKNFYPLLVIFFMTPFLKYPERHRQILFFLLIVIIPIQIVFLSDLYKGYMFLQRQWVWVISLFSFFMGWQWDALAYSLQERLKRYKISQS